MAGSWAPAVNIYFCLAIGCWKTPEVLNDSLILWAIRENTPGSSKGCTSYSLRKGAITCSYMGLGLASCCADIEPFVALGIASLVSE